MLFLEPIQMPDKVEFDKKTYNSSYGKVEIGPLEPGFATTLGNTLRRVLLSSIQGSAVRYVRIEGLHHEFCPIPGTNIDYIDLILKLKKLVIKVNSVNEIKLTLEHKGQGIVTAKHLSHHPDVEIFNEDLEFFEMVDDGYFVMELWVGNGRGYVSADDQKIDDEKPVGVIPIDSIYSPITKVSFNTLNQRVGEKIDYDKLEMEIFTNGSIEPKDALYLSAKILRDFYSKIVLFEEEPEYIEEVEMDEDLDTLEKLLKTNVKELELTVRSANCLEAAGVDTIGDLVSRTENDMLKYKNFGKKSLDEIVSLLNTYELHLGMDVDSIYKKIEDAKNRLIKKKKD